MYGDTFDEYNRAYADSLSPGPDAPAYGCLEHLVVRRPDAWNNEPKPYVWTKTADQILESIRRYCTTINDSGH